MNNKLNNFSKRLTHKPLLDKIEQADNLYYQQQKYNEAIEAYNKILEEIDEDYNYEICECYRKIGDCYYLQQQLDNARTAYEKTLEYCDTNGGVYAILAYLYYYLDNDIAINYYNRAKTLNPKDESSTSSKCLTMLKSHKYDQKLIKEIFEKDMEKAKAVFMEGEAPFTHDINKLKNKKKLNIGYLSSDFYNHAMMQFILPLIEGHDINRFNFTLYSTSKKSDYVTDRLKKTGMNFKDCSDLTNKQLAQLIYDDKIDILIDLGGFTHNRCFTLFYKPAPIQMQYLGFINTMGMKDIDYIFADEFTIPKNMAKYYTEKPLYLNTWMTRFNLDIDNPKWPQLNEPPFKQNGYITFGSYNCPSKINSYTIELWAKLLKRVPNSKLLIYRSQMTDKVIQNFRNKFIELEIEEDRVIFNNSPLGAKPHFYAYQLADIALDPTPFNGLTITTELIAMGVPVLTLAGKSMQSRGCARVNKALELDELIAETEEQYIEKAYQLAQDRDMIEYYRYNLRYILSTSILTNGFNEFAQNVENAYQKAWNKYIKQHSKKN